MFASILTIRGLYIKFLLDVFAVVYVSQYAFIIINIIINIFLQSFPLKTVLLPLALSRIRDFCHLLEDN